MPRNCNRSNHPSHSCRMYLCRERSRSDAKNCMQLFIFVTSQREAGTQKDPYRNFQTCLMLKGPPPYQDFLSHAITTTTTAWTSATATAMTTPGYLALRGSKPYIRLLFQVQRALPLARMRVWSSGFSRALRYISRKTFLCVIFPFGDLNARRSDGKTRKISHSNMVCLCDFCIRGAMMKESFWWEIISGLSREPEKKCE